MPLNKVPISLLSTTENAVEAATIQWDQPTQAIKVSETYIFQGSVSGYSSGGAIPTSNVIDKFPFTTDGNATDVGDLTQGRYGSAGQSSSFSGYTSGGYNRNTIDKFPFAANASATDVGDLSQARDGAAGQSYFASGYTSGGRTGIPAVTSTRLDKFPFSTNANATNIGDLTQSRRNVTGQSSLFSGYSSGGRFTPPAGTTSNVIDKFPFAADGNATDVGDLTTARQGATGQSSTTHGYSSGGRLTPPAPTTYSNIIDRFPFASNANASDVGDLSVAGGYSAGQSSTASGYTSGGFRGAQSNVIDKFPFSTNANATDVGDLTIARYFLAGQQI